MMSAFAEWLASTSGSVALHESLFMYPVVESVHVLTLCIFVGLAATLDLRLMGVTLTRTPVSEVARRLLPWMVGGFVAHGKIARLPAKTVNNKSTNATGSHATNPSRIRIVGRDQRAVVMR